MFTKSYHFVFACIAAFSANLTFADEFFNKRVDKAVKHSITLIEKSMDEYLNHRECFSCHHQALPVLALATAKRYGYKTDAKKFQAQIEHTLQHFQKNRQKYLEGKGTGGQVDTAGYGLWALAAGKVKKSESTGAVVKYLLNRDVKRKFWRRSSERPPSEASNFTSTFLAINALRNFGAKKEQDKISERIRRAMNWMEETECRDTEDMVFKINTLALMESNDQMLKKLADRLLKNQKDDGGWAQKKGMESDAYATATVLYALVQSGQIERNDGRFTKGVDYLINTQKPGGSWFVKSRSDPFQEYFESGFPHGTDQFISITATCWAVMALSDWRANDKKSEN